ncbi:MAG: Outer membrane beta-barrel assembly protein BamE [uncultured Microvirga sp.]|uniref:Outer membrane beta-barrel assembly protein BamE n=1 Tax=uncultured Microvirga sp. TaxID=412392 RepID=A0A6J4LTK3_9HYPH|nr:MAG: Outer membrane beta-barrel assembly protein BamE [uncultured Microvirga sp.]
MPCQSHNPVLGQIRPDDIKHVRRDVGKVSMNRQKGKILVRLAAAAFVLGAPAGALAEDFVRGYMIDERTLSQVKPGMMPEQVLKTLGSPSTVSTVGNKSWYYISQTTRRRFQFLPESVVDQRVTAVYFAKNMKVERVAQYGVQDGVLFDFVSRTTPSGGGDQNFLGQIFKGVTKFSPI